MKSLAELAQLREKTLAKINLRKDMMPLPES